MRADLVQFLPLLHGNGFAWVNSGGEPVLADLGGERRRWAMGERRGTFPPTAFRDFCQLDGAHPDAVLAFVGRYGLLRAGIEGLTVPLPGGTDEDAFTIAEPLSEWRRLAATMNRTVQLWEAVLAQDVGPLKGRYEFLRDRHRDGWMRVIPPPGGIGEFTLPRPDDEVGRLFAAARREVVLVVNAALKGRTEFALDDRTDPPARVVRPRDLLTALWCLVARWVTGGKEHHQCRQCGEWFEVGNSVDGRSARRESCSERCRSKKYRTRKAKAAELAESGYDLHQIAAELNTPVRRVRGWLNRSRRPPGS